MSRADATHFDAYREHTKTKHRILTGYLPAYYNILKQHHLNLLYIDDFAGCGHYKNETGTVAGDGSPILAMKLFASNAEYREKVQCFFVEPRDDHFADLQRAVDAQQASSPLARTPIVMQCNYGDFADLLAHHLEQGSELAPTFLFVDPCGVKGVRLKDIVQVLSRQHCEVFVFFNYDGVNRIVGHAQQSGGSQTLLELFGSEARVRGDS